MRRHRHFYGHKRNIQNGRFNRVFATVLQSIIFNFIQSLIAGANVVGRLDALVSRKICWNLASTKERRAKNGNGFETCCHYKLSEYTYLCSDHVNILQTKEFPLPSYGERGNSRNKSVCSENVNKKYFLLLWLFFCSVRDCFWLVCIMQRKNVLAWAGWSNRVGRATKHRSEADTKEEDITIDEQKNFFFVQTRKSSSLRYIFFDAVMFSLSASLPPSLSLLSLFLFSLYGWFRLFDVASQAIVSISGAHPKWYCNWITARLR